MESMCVACHGPVRRNRWGQTAIHCGVNCHRLWYRLKDGAPLPTKYELIRASHAYRRELEATLRSIERRVVLRQVS